MLVVLSSTVVVVVLASMVVVVTLSSMVVVVVVHCRHVVGHGRCHSAVSCAISLQPWRRKAKSAIRTPRATARTDIMGWVQHTGCDAKELGRTRGYLAAKCYVDPASCDSTSTLLLPNKRRSLQPSELGMGPRLHDGRMGRGQSLLLLGQLCRRCSKTSEGGSAALSSREVLCNPLVLGRGLGRTPLIVVTVRTGLDARSAPAYWVS